MLAGQMALAYLYLLFKAKPLTGRRPRDGQVK